MSLFLEPAEELSQKVMFCSGLQPDESPCSWPGQEQYQGALVRSLTPHSPPPGLFRVVYKDIYLRPIESILPPVSEIPYSDWQLVCSWLEPVGEPQCKSGKSHGLASILQPSESTDLALRLPSQRGAISFSLGGRLVAWGRWLIKMYRLP